MSFNLGSTSSAQTYEAIRGFEVLTLTEGFTDCWGPVPFERLRACLAYHTDAMMPYRDQKLTYEPLSPDDLQAFRSTHDLLMKFVEVVKRCADVQEPTLRHMEHIRLCEKLYKDVQERARKSMEYEGEYDPGLELIKPEADKLKEQNYWTTAVGAHGSIVVPKLQTQWLVLRSAYNLHQVMQARNFHPDDRKDEKLNFIRDQKTLPSLVSIRLLEPFRHTANDIDRMIAPLDVFGVEQAIKHIQHYAQAIGSINFAHA